MLLTPLQLWLTGPRVIRTVNHDKPIIQGIKGSSEVSFDGQYTYETHKMSNSMVLGGIEKVI